MLPTESYNLGSRTQKKQIWSSKFPNYLPKCPASFSFKKPFFHLICTNLLFRNLYIFKPYTTMRQSTKTSTCLAENSIMIFLNHSAEHMTYNNSLLFFFKPDTHLKHTRHVLTEMFRFHQSHHQMVGSDGHKQLIVRGQSLVRSFSLL